MNTKKLTRLITTAAVLFSFLFGGCAQMSSSGTMGDSRGTMMEERADEMNTPVMNGTMETKMKDESMMQEPMNQMNEQKMGATAEDMKKGTEKDTMMGEKDKKMDIDKDKMMK